METTANGYQDLRMIYSNTLYRLASNRTVGPTIIIYTSKHKLKVIEELQFLRRQSQRISRPLH